jgi:hypothetical protein
MSDIELKAGWLKRDIQSAAKRAAKTRGTPMSDTIEQVIERLTFRLKRAAEDELGLVTVAEADLRALLAERERLREALNRYVQCRPQYVHAFEKCVCVECEARAALTAGETG